jgi:hypothetical protein
MNTTKRMGRKTQSRRKKSPQTVHQSRNPRQPISDSIRLVTIHEY